MRVTLRDERIKRGLSQKEVAASIGINERSYSFIECGKRIGGIPVWDALEDLFNLPQRQLRKTQSEPDGNQT